MVLLKHLYIVANALSTVTIEDSDCPSVSYPGLNVGTVTDPKVDEASGLVASQFNPGVFWTLNDSEGPSCLYALAVNGSLLHTMCLEGAINYDWEAISTAPCDDK